MLLSLDIHLIDTSELTKDENELLGFLKEIIQFCNGIGSQSKAAMVNAIVEHGPIVDLEQSNLNKARVIAKISRKIVVENFRTKFVHCLTDPNYKRRMLRYVDHVYQGDAVKITEKKQNVEYFFSHLTKKYSKLFHLRAVEVAIISLTLMGAIEVIDSIHPKIKSDSLRKITEKARKDFCTMLSEIKTYSTQSFKRVDDSKPPGSTDERSRLPGLTISAANSELASSYIAINHDATMGDNDLLMAISIELNAIFDAEIKEGIVVKKGKVSFYLPPDTERDTSLVWYYSNPFENNSQEYVLTNLRRIMLSDILFSPSPRVIMRKAIDNLADFTSSMINPLLSYCRLLWAQKISSTETGRAIEQAATQVTSQVATIAQETIQFLQPLSQKLVDGMVVGMTVTGETIGEYTARVCDYCMNYVVEEKDLITINDPEAEQRIHEMRVDKMLEDIAAAEAIIHEFDNESENNAQLPGAAPPNGESNDVTSVRVSALVESFVPVLPEQPQLEVVDSVSSVNIPRIEANAQPKKEYSSHLVKIKNDLTTYRDNVINKVSTSFLDTFKNKFTTRRLDRTNVCTKDIIKLIDKYLMQQDESAEQSLKKFANEFDQLVQSQLDRIATENNFFKSHYAELLEELVTDVPWDSNLKAQLLETKRVEARQMLLICR